MCRKHPWKDLKGRSLQLAGHVVTDLGEWVPLRASGGRKPLWKLDLANSLVRTRLNRVERFSQQEVELM